MEISSTPFEKKTVKRSKPSRRVIENILNYSRTLATVSAPLGKAILIVNN